MDVPMPIAIYVLNNKKKQYPEKKIWRKTRFRLILLKREYHHHQRPTDDMYPFEFVMKSLTNRSNITAHHLRQEETMIEKHDVLWLCCYAIS